MPTFRPYPSITQSSDRWKTTPEKRVKFHETEWVVTEKIHGANFSMIVTPSEDSTLGALKFECAKRTNIIREDENFFGYKPVAERYKDNVLLLYRNVKERFPNVTQVNMFAELYGGRYEVECGGCKDVDQSENHDDDRRHDTEGDGVRAVQTEIQYRPDIDIIAFDIEFTENGCCKFMDWDDMVPLLDQCAIPRTKEAFRGSLKDALALPIAFRTRIPEELGLPPIEGNKCEGVVIRPVKELTVGGGKTPQRCLIKKKNAEFQEMTFDPNVRHSEHDSGVQVLIYEFQRRITDNRLDATISKIGEIQDRKNFKPILDFFVADTMKDTLADEGEERWGQLTDREQGRVKNEVMKMCSRMMASRVKQGT